MSPSPVLSDHFSLSEWSKWERLEKKECFSGNPSTNPDSSDSEAFDAEDVNYAWVETQHMLTGLIPAFLFYNGHCRETWPPFYTPICLYTPEHLQLGNYYKKIILQYSNIYFLIHSWVCQNI